jgi:hypothetical protein
MASPWNKQIHQTEGWVMRGYKGKTNIATGAASFGIPLSVSIGFPLYCRVSSNNTVQIGEVEAYIYNSNFTKILLEQIQRIRWNSLR